MTKQRMCQFIEALVDDHLDGGCGLSYLQELFVTQCGITWDEATELGLDYLWPDGELALQEMYG